MIDFAKFNTPSLFDDVDKIFKEFKDQNMPSECYGWRSWRIEKTIEKHSNNQLIWVDKRGYDFISGNVKYEFKQVKDAFKKITTPSITIKNYRGKCLGLSEKTFDYLIVMDVDRRMLAMYNWDYVSKVFKLNDANVTAVLELSEAIDVKLEPNGLSELL